MENSYKIIDDAHEKDQFTVRFSEIVQNHPFALHFSQILLDLKYLMLIMVTIIDKSRIIMYNTDIHNKKQNAEKFSGILITKQENILKKWRPDYD